MWIKMDCFLQSLEVSLNPVDEGSGDGQSSPSDVSERFKSDVSITQVIIVN